MASKIVDLTGKVFGRWKVIGLSKTNRKSPLKWECECSCGNKRDVLGASLKNGRSKSCGCYHKEKVTTHNMTGLQTFKSWESMKQRCLNMNSPDYLRYGGRGIKICDRWINSFDNFLSDMGERPKGKTLDRIDNNGNYEPSNCKWSSITEQLSNRRNTIKVMYNDSLKTIKELSYISGLSERIIRDRLSAGWDIQKIITTQNRKAKIS